MKISFKTNDLLTFRRNIGLVNYLANWMHEQYFIS